MESLRKISKKLAYILRHNPGNFGIKLDEEGWADISEIEEKAGIRRADILRVVNSQRKKRFEVKDGKIRALYGHTCIKLKYRPVEPPNFLYHGTSPERAKQIIEKGLKPMRRHYVHLSQSVEGALEVGRRHSRTPVVIKVMAKEAFRNGIPFYLAGDTYLTPYLPPQFLELMKQS